VVFFEDSFDFVTRVTALDPRPDVVFLDIHVKPADGYEMLRILRELDSYRGIPIVALTASVMNEEVELLRTSGFDGCIAKPIDLDTFPETLDRILRGEIIWRVVG
jgi:CheY-like chemotaxis protein